MTHQHTPCTAQCTTASTATRGCRGLLRTSKLPVRLASLAILLTCWTLPVTAYSQEIESDGQRLSAHAQRVVEALQSLGFPLDVESLNELATARRNENVAELERILDKFAICTVTINPESRVKVDRGTATAQLQQAGYVPWLVKLVNQGAVKSPLQVSSPQAGPSFSGVALLSMQRQDQLPLRENEAKPGAPRRFLQLTWFNQAPMAPAPSGAKVEYALLLAYSSEAGQRELGLEFSLGSGTQDLGFRAQLPLLVDSKPALPVRLNIRDEKGEPAFARLTIRDSRGFVYPPQPRRLAPDLFFQQQIYREHGESVGLPPGHFVVESSQGPETIVHREHLQVQEQTDNEWRFQIQPWVRPMEFGWYSGDHHIHGAGCAHYTSPTEGVTPQDMFRQVAGEGLNVGCILTWGPCFEFQRQFFRPSIDAISRPKTLLKYDLEISGFGSQALGHVCLLNLREQYYPGSDGTKEKGWPTWATPALKWAKAQGAVTGFAHSASGLQIDPALASERLLKQLDPDASGLVSMAEATQGLLPASFAAIDTDHDGGLSRVELHSAIDAAADTLPNLAIPEMNSVGAMELPVAVAAGVCDFISTMDTARIAEWNMWYHLLNCGFPLKASGETDFPCMSGNAVGQGRVYVQLGKVARIDFTAWCNGLAQGRSYVSDGYAHALALQATSASATAHPGDSLHLDAPEAVKVIARMAIAPQMPRSVAYATRVPEGGRRLVGDTVTLHGSRTEDWVAPGTREIELVVNGKVVQTKSIPCDGQEQLIEFTAQIESSSWLAVRVFPHLHTNPIEVIVAERPIRVSSESARWCIATIEQLWSQRERNISPDERIAAKRTFDAAIAEFQRRFPE